MASKLASGEGFTLEDFVEQLAMVRKMGPIANVLGMLPGAAQNRELLSQVNDKDLDRAAAIVSSMTPEERRNPKILNGSRRARIAAGSGVTVGEVSNLIVRFLEGQKMMRQMMGNMPGLGGIAPERKASRQGQEEGQGWRPPGGLWSRGPARGRLAGRPRRRGQPSYSATWPISFKNGLPGGITPGLLSSGLATARTDPSPVPAGRPWRTPRTGQLPPGFRGSQARRAAEPLADYALEGRRLAECGRYARSREAPLTR